LPKLWIISLLPLFFQKITKYTQRMKPQTLFPLLLISFLSYPLALLAQNHPAKVFVTETEGWGYAPPSFFRLELWLSGEGATAAEAEKTIKSKGDALAKKMGEGSTTSFSSTYGPPFFGANRGLLSPPGEVNMFRSFGFPVSPSELNGVLTLISTLKGAYVLRIVPLSDKSAAEVQAQQTALQKAQTWVEGLKGRGVVANDLIIKSMQVKGCQTYAHFPGWNDFPALPMEGQPLANSTQEAPPLEALPDMLSVRCSLLVTWEKP
jgi:hypothetical protein